MSDTINKTKSVLLEDLECPVCSYYMLPPVRMCVTGHSFCDDCFASMNRCAICRAQKSKSRNFVFENMLKKFVIPCRYSVNGCTFEAKGSSMVEHKEYCDFGEWVCDEHEECNWTGFRKDVFQHYEDSDMLQTLKHYTINSKEWKKDSEYYMITEANFGDLNFTFISTYVFRIHDKSFMFYYITTENNDYIPFCVFYIGDPNEAKNYYYKIKVQNPSFKEDVIEIKNKCQPIKNKHSFSDKNFINEHSLVLPFSLLKSYCDEYGDLSFGVKIFKLELETELED